MLSDSCTVFLQAQLCNPLRCSPVLLLLLRCRLVMPVAFVASCVAVRACFMLSLHAAAVTVGTDGVLLASMCSGSHLQCL